MTAEERYFLNVISDYIKGDSTALDESIDLKALEKTAKSQSMAGIVYAQCKEFLTIGSGFEECFSGNVFSYVCNSEDFKELKSTFAEAGIDMLTFKGLELAKYHPVPQLRTMGDIDLLIHPADRKKAHELMLSLGYECKNTGDAVWTYTRDVVKVEIHEHMIYEKLSGDFDYEQYFDGAWDSAKDGSLDPNVQFLFLATHTAKHMLNCGSGFRPFLDMVFMAKSGELDWQFICAELKKLELLRFVKVSFAMCKRWFGIKPPVECEDVSEEFFADATEKMFSDGLFGFDNKKNANAHMAKDLKRKENLGWLAMLDVMLRKLFPKENTLAHLKFYSFLFRHRILRPIAWIYRFIYSAATRFVPSMKTLFYPVTRRKEIKMRHKFMENWGL